MTETPQRATASAHRPPSAATSAPSTKYCSTSRDRGAPSATRIVSSRRRAVLRTMSRLPTFVQVINSTSPANPSVPAAAAGIVHGAGTVPCRRTGARASVRRPIAALSRLPPRRAAGRAPPTTPGLLIADAGLQTRDHLLRGGRVRGDPEVRGSFDQPGRGTRAARRRRSCTAFRQPSRSGRDLGAAPNRVRHKPQPRTAAAPSDATGIRPTSGVTPRSWKKFSETCSTSGRLRDTVDRDHRAVQAPEADEFGNDLTVRPDLIEHRLSEGAAGLPEPASPVTVCCASTSRSGSRTGSERSSRLSTRLNSAVLAPMPSASDSVTTHGERRALPEHAHAVPQILREHVQHGHASLLAVHFAERHRPAEFPERFMPRVGVRQAAAAAFVDEQLQMRGQLFVELAVQPVSSHHRPRAGPDRAEPCLHRSGPPLASTRPITAASLSQFSVSATSCFSPARVMV